MTTTIDLLRHGETDLNANRAFINGRNNDVRLNDCGVLQAKQAGLWMSRHGYRPDLALSSPAVRARDTLRYALATAGHSLPILLDPDFQEIDQGEATGKLRTDIWTPEESVRAKADPLHHKLPGGESNAEVQQRMLHAVRRVGAQYPDRHVVVGGHGLAIRNLAGIVLGLTLGEIHRLPMPNASLTRLAVNSTGDVTIDFHGRDIAAEAQAYLPY